jgi:hypothetical protein
MKRSNAGSMVLLATLLLGTAACSSSAAPTARAAPSATPVAAHPLVTLSPTPAALQLAAATALVTSSPTPAPSSPTPGATTSAVPSAAAKLTSTPTPSATPSGTATMRLVPSATQTRAPSALSPVAIRQFQARVRDESLGKRLTFTWESDGATSATITIHARPAAPLVWNVPASGTQTGVVSDDALVSNPVVTLEVRNDSGNRASASLVLAWPCRYAFFFSPAPAVCADAGQTTAAAEQVFQYGRMLWVQQLGPDIGQLIYVLYSSGKYDVYRDPWQEGDPTAETGNAPAGLQQPTRGFGKIWRDNPNVREGLGWAINREQGFTTIAQSPRPDGSRVPVYVRTLSGSVVVFQPSGYWDDIGREGASAQTPTAFSVSVTPAGLTLPAGAAATVMASLSEWQQSWPAPTWSLVGLPRGSSSATQTLANPANVLVQIRTTCSVAPGTYPLELTITSGTASQSARFYLTVAGSLSDSAPTTMKGSFSENTIDIRRGGPSTLTFGPYVTLSFCDSTQERRLRVTLIQATTALGAPLPQTALPRLSLFSISVWPVPQSIQTMSGGYAPNARQVAASQGWSLEWPIEGGLYVLAFERSPLATGDPLAYVTYTVEIAQ